MALSDQNIQELQKSVLDTIETVPKKEKFTTEDGREYYLINKTNETTQAIAVAPVLGNGEIDYSHTTIVVAGTQTPRKINNHVGESFANATKSTIFGLTDQTKDIEDFYLDTSRRIASENGFISNMSGHSQAGPGVAYTASKYGLKQNRSIKVTNFMDFAAKKAVDTGGISKEQVAYLNKNATIYRDSRSDVVFLDGNNGDVPYGKTMRFEVEEGQDGHSPRTPVMKGDKLDVDYYYRKNLFASGMTEKQVRKVIKAKLKAIKSGKNKEFLTSLNPNYYLMLYKKMYGDFAPELSNQEQLSINRQLIDKLHASLKTSSGDKKISLREELVRTSAQTAQLQAEVYEQEIKDKLASAKSKVEEHISELSKAAYTLAHNLSAGEVEDLLSELSLSTAWNGGTEASTLASASAYTTKMTEIAGNLNKAADNIVAIDQKGVQIFTKK